MFERITGPSDSSGLGEPFEVSTLIHPCLQIHAWYSPEEVNVPELPWPCWKCLKEGVTSIVMVGSLKTPLGKLLRIFFQKQSNSKLISLMVEGNRLCLFQHCLAGGLKYYVWV